MNYINNGHSLLYEGKDTMGMDTSRYQTNIPFGIESNIIYYFEAEMG